MAVLAVLTGGALETPARAAAGDSALIWQIQEDPAMNTPVADRKTLYLSRTRSHRLGIIAGVLAGDQIVCRIYDLRNQLVLEQTDAVVNNAIQLQAFDVDTSLAVGTYTLQLFKQTEESAAGLIKRSKPAVLELMVTNDAVYDLGDVSYDGSINAADAAALARYLAGKYTLSSEALLLSDINLSGQINAADVTQLARYLVGKDALGNDKVLPPVMFEEDGDGFISGAY